jgi:N-acetylneuraminate lyase
MPELFLKMNALLGAGDLAGARRVQYMANEIIYAMCACRGNMYAVAKKLLEMREELSLGSVRAPLMPLESTDMPQVIKCRDMIDEAVRTLI